MSKRVLLIHRYFWPSNISTLPRMLGDYVESLNEYGYQLTVVTSDDLDYSKLRKRRFKTDVKIHTCKLPIDRNLNFILRLFSITYFTIRAIFYCISKKNDILITISYPPLLSFVLSFVFRIFNRNRKVIFIVQDILEYRLPTKCLKKVYRYFMKETISRSEIVITLSEEMKKTLTSYMGDDSSTKKIKVLQNFFPINSESLCSENSKGDIIYAGAIGKAQNLNHLFSALSNIKLLEREVFVYGSGTEKEFLKKKFENSSIHFKDPVPQEIISQVICNSDIGLVGANPDLFKYAFPSKLITYANLGAFSLVCGEPNSPLASWLKSHKIGLVIDSKDVNKATLQIIDFLSSDGLPKREEIMSNARELFSKEKHLKEFVNFIERI